VALEEATRRCRALQTERFLPIPDTSHVDCRTNACHRIESRCSLSHRIIADLVVEHREITSRQVEIELNQLQVRFENKKRHCAHLVYHVISTDAKNLDHNSGYHARFVLFDQGTLLQFLEKFRNIVLSKVPTNAEFPADLIDNRSFGGTVLEKFEDSRPNQVEVEHLTFRTSSTIAQSWV